MVLQLKGSVLKFSSSHSYSINWLLILLVWFYWQTPLAQETELNSRLPDLVVEYIGAETPVVMAEDLELISKIVNSSAREVALLLPNLPSHFTIEVRFVEQDFNHWGMSMGVNGRAETPDLIIIEISTSNPLGLAALANKNLSLLVFHELHHLARGWTINDNKFEPGIHIAAVNEGLAVVFSEQYAPGGFQDLAYPDEGEKWLAEIIELPIDADYNTWMNQHPDGRHSIGYRTGKFIIASILENEGIDILELGSYSPERILQLIAGVTLN